MTKLLAPRIRRALAFFGVIVLFALVPATAASAHAELSVTDPADGAVVETAPKALTLEFTEGVSLRPDGVRVLDAKGARVDASNATSSGSVVTVPLRSAVADGSYAVAWRVVSADGHPVHGAFTFSVGQESSLDANVADQAFGSGNDRIYEQLAAALRIVSYVAVLGACGFALVAAALRRPQDPSPVTHRTVLAASVGLGAVVLQIPFQGALATGRGLGAITESAVLGLALGEGMGLAALVTGAGLIALIITGGLPFESATRRVALGGAVLAPLGFAISGHTRTMSPAVVAYAADAAHLAAAAVWFGGLIAVVTAIRLRRRQDDPLGAAEAIATFSGWAMVTAGVVVAAGTALGWIEVGGWHALSSTTYGRLLLAKVVAVLVVLVTAAWNRLRLVPHVAAKSIEDPPADDAPAWTSLVRLIRVEVMLMVAVLIVTGVLANVTPAKAAAKGGVVTVTAPLGEGTVEVNVDPARPGRNDIHVYIQTKAGRPDDRYKTATIRLNLADRDLGPFDRQPIRSGPGHFQLVATPLALPGVWTVTVTVKTDAFTEQSAEVQVKVR